MFLCTVHRTRALRASLEGSLIAVRIVAEPSEFLTETLVCAAMEVLVGGGAVECDLAVPTCLETIGLVTSGSRALPYESLADLRAVLDCDGGFLEK